MNQLLLVIILLTDPSAQPAADALSGRLASATTRVVVGPQALAALTERGLTDADLVAQPQVGLTLTARERQVAIVRIDRSLRGGNVTIESLVWAGGRREQHVAISGGKRTVTAADGAVSTVLDEPIDSVARGISDILSPWLAAAGAPPAQLAEAQLASLAERKEWQQIVALTQEVAQPTPRVRYYRILALHALARIEEAETAYAAFKQAAPTHVLLATLDEVLHPKAEPQDANQDMIDAQTEDDGSNVLK